MLSALEVAVRSGWVTLTARWLGECAIVRVGDQWRLRFVGPSAPRVFLITDSTLAGCVLQLRDALAKSLCVVFARSVSVAISESLTSDAMPAKSSPTAPAEDTGASNGRPSNGKRLRGRRGPL